MQIISRFWSREWQAVTSKILQFEINKISDLTKRLGPQLRVRVENPDTWLQEAIENGGTSHDR